MTKEQFLADYAKGSGMTIDQLPQYGLLAVPCNCGDALCKGWRMLSTTHRRERR